MKNRLLLLTPPLLQPNCPYPATMHLTGFLAARGFDVHQRDLSIKVVLEILRAYGGGDADELLEFLQGPAPAEAKRAASAAIDDLALQIRQEIDPDFGFSRYAEHLSAAVRDFGEVERRVRRRGVIDRPLERHLAEAIDAVRPTVIGVTCPFPGTLVGAFKIARWVRRHCPGVRLVLGGGYVSTELREMTDRRPYRYFDDFVLDDGYAAMARILSPRTALTDADVPAFVRPSYRGIDMSEYFDVVETDNPVVNLWNSGKWRRLVMARGCYWHKCAFCDVRLPYIGCFRLPAAAEIVDAMQALGTSFHFVDEAMPPALVRGVCEEILRRGYRCEWWGNIRFDAAFTPELARLMARAGCIAVTGGLECANDRLLALMNKGITRASAKRVLRAFRMARIAVHAYLMYAFPTETAVEAMDALDYVRDLFREGLVQSAFWHRFALTVHSPVAKNPAAFGIRVLPSPPPPSRPRGAGVFAVNELAYEECGAPDWDRLGRVLRTAVYNYARGAGLDRSAAYWRRKVT
jgi:hypothetical protein